MTTQRERILTLVAELGDTPEAIRSALLKRGYKLNMTGVEHFLAFELEGSRYAGTVQELGWPGRSVFEYLEDGVPMRMELPATLKAFEEMLGP